MDARSHVSHMSQESREALAQRIRSRLLHAENPPADHDVSIVGGGVAALTLALEIRRARPTTRILIIEPNEQTYKATAAYIAAGFPHRTAPLHAQVRGIVTHFLGAGQCTNELVAADLKLHPRTLHRRLAAGGSSFQKIKNGVRRDLMLYYFRQTDMDFTGISQKLGFAEQSEMTRCCNRWFHASPTRLRLEARSVPPVEAAHFV